jgi:hypothetical protein
MSTVTKPKKPAAKTRRAAAKKSGALKRLVPDWIGSAEGKVFVRPGVDLTKPTLAPGELL